eukprot:jgi/Psemu1/18622/gm1.18622_g
MALQKGNKGEGQTNGDSVINDSEDLDISKASPLIKFVPAALSEFSFPTYHAFSTCSQLLSLPHSYRQGQAVRSRYPTGTIMYGAIRSPGSTHKCYTAPHGTSIVAKHRTTKFNLEPTPALASGTYLFIKTKPGVLSAMVSLPIEAVTDEETQVEQWLLQRHTFSQWEAVFRTILTSFKDSTGDKTLSPSNVQDVLTKVEERYPDLQGPTTEALAPWPGNSKKLYLSSVDLQLSIIKLIIGKRNGDHLDTLMNANARLTKDLGKLKSQPPALAKAKQDKVTQLFNYFSPDLSELSARIHAGIMASLGGILEFFKACST